jgi:hypothetical protein
LSLFTANPEAFEPCGTYAGTCGIPQASGECRYFMMQFSGRFVDYKPNRYGKLPLNPSATSLPGWYFTAVVLQPTSSPKEDGHMTLFASYARELLEQPIICVLYARL